MDDRRKRALMRASRRGMKEMDILLGSFAAAQVPKMDASRLAAFEALLGLPDADLFRWIIGADTPPPEWAEWVEALRAGAEGRGVDPA